jgi:hypothetical protein
MLWKIALTMPFTFRSQTTISWAVEKGIKNDTNVHCFNFDFFSFLLTRKKLVQNELKLLCPFLISGSSKKKISNNRIYCFLSHFEDQRHIPCITKKQHGKELFKLYKLWQSRLVFTLANRVDDNGFNIFSESSVSSQVMIDEMHKNSGNWKNTTLSILSTSSVFFIRRRHCCSDRHDKWSWWKICHLCTRKRQLVRWR